MDMLIKTPELVVTSIHKEFDETFQEVIARLNDGESDLYVRCHGIRPAYATSNKTMRVWRIQKPDYRRGHRGIYAEGKLYYVDMDGFFYRAYSDLSESDTTIFLPTKNLNAADKEATLTGLKAFLKKLKCEDA